MRRRSVLRMLAVVAALVACVPVDDVRAQQKLTPPATGQIPVAFVLSEGATMIDFAGPWEVFQDVMVPGRGDEGGAFRLYTVAESAAPIRVSGGMQIVPDFTFANAPAPKVIVIPAQSSRSQAVTHWIRTSSKQTDVVMSVCTGAFLLATTGLLDGHPATTHHSFYSQFETTFPKVPLQRGKRFVEGARIATAGGLTSGIDLALRVVERYFGRGVAEHTADLMEYQSEGWRDATGGANAKYAQANARHGTCPVCHMDLPATFVTLVQDGQTRRFCSDLCKQKYLKDPARSRARPQ